VANQAHSGIQGQPWHRCQRCGTDQRLSMLVRQNGILVCITNDCADNRLIERRPRMIMEKLRSGREMQPDTKLTEEYVDDTIDQI
jgi:hypothetical protein